MTTTTVEHPAAAGSVASDTGNAAASRHRGLNKDDQEIILNALDCLTVWGRKDERRAAYVLVQRLGVVAHSFDPETDRSSWARLKPCGEFGCDLLWCDHD